MGGSEKISQYSRLLREYVIKEAGGSSEFGRMIGATRQKVNAWMKRGFPMNKCTELAVLLYSDIEQKYLFNFERIHEYEKYGKKLDLLSMWRVVIKNAPISGEAKKQLLTMRG